MTSSNTLKKLVSIGAAMLLAVGGSLVAAQPASATVNSNVSAITSYRLTSATRNASGSTYVVHALTGESMRTFTYDEDFGANQSGGALSLVFTFPSNVQVQNYTGSSSLYATVTPTTTATGAAQSSVNGTPATSPWTTYTATVPADSLRTSLNARVEFTFTGLSSGTDLSVNVVATLAGTPIAPTGSHTTMDSGSTRVRGTSSYITHQGDSYTAITGDFAATPSISYSNSCVWPGSTTAVANDPIKAVWSNPSGPSVIATNGNLSYWNGTTQLANGTPSTSETTFTVPSPAPEKLTVNAGAVITISAAGDVIAPAVKVVKSNTTNDLLEPCYRNEALPAVVASSASATSVTLTLVPPTTSTHYTGWQYASVYACVTTITNCGSQSPSGPPNASFSGSAPVLASATSVTISASTMRSYSMMQTTWDPTVSYKYVVLYMANTGTNYQGMTAESNAVAATVSSVNSNSSNGSNSNSNANSTSVATESAKPLPVWAAPILKQVPSLSKTLNTDGGKVALTDGDFSSLKSVTIGGKPVVFSTDAKGDVFIPVPAGKAGTSADLVVTFAGGSMVIQDGIKYVAPTDVASVPESTLAGFTKKSTKVTGALAASILYAAQVDHKATSIVCNGYAASKSDVALATARAQAACDYATGAYANLTKATVAVVVNKAKAKSAALGIKVYH